MRADVTQLKNELRRQLRAELRKLPDRERTAASAQACDLLQQQPVWLKARTALLYAPLPDELDIWPLVKESLTDGKVVALPRYDPKQHSYAACRVQNLEVDLAVGKFGIREPVARCPVVPLNKLDFILVPGVGFDLDGHRLGRGQGYYDRWLTSVRGTKCGLAFDQQVGIKIPAEPHDIRLDYLLTPTRWLAVTGRSRV